MPKVTPEKALPLIDDVASARAARDSATVALIGATHRAVEAGATSTDVAAAAGVTRQTILAWATIPVLGDTVNVVHMQRRAIAALGGTPAWESLAELVAQRSELADALRRGEGPDLDMEGEQVLGAAILAESLARRTGAETVTLRPSEAAPWKN